MVINIIICVFLGICSYTDIRKKAVYLKVMLPFLLTGVILCFTSKGAGITDAVLGVVVGLFILLLSFVTKGAIGEGDGIVLIITGIYLGFLGNIKLLSMALFLSACVSVAFLVIKKCGRNAELPFMPFLFTSFIVMRAQEMIG